MKVIDPELRRLIGEAGKYSKDMDKDHQLTFEKAIDEVMGIIEAYETLYGDSWKVDYGEKKEEAPFSHDPDSPIGKYIESMSDDVEEPALTVWNGSNTIFVESMSEVEHFHRYPICGVCPRFRNDVGIQYDYAMCEHGLFRERDL